MPTTKAANSPPTRGLRVELRRLLHLGVPAGELGIEARRTLLSNQLGLAGLLLTQPFFWPNLHEIFAATTILTFWLLTGLMFWLNARGYLRVARLVFVGGLINLFYFLGLIVPARWPETKTGFVLLQLAFASLPLVLFSLKRNRWLVLGLLLYITAQIMLFPTLDQALELIDPPMSYDKAHFQNYIAIAVAVLVQVLALGFYQQVARKAEGQARQLLHATTQQNHRLLTQEQEIRQSAAELRATNDYMNQTLAQLEVQQRVLEKQQQHTLESIHYAQRIQEAILPPVQLIRSYLPESFVFYRPRDIVSGDFYWLNATADRLFLAVVDCTGHGVPGAFMSVLAYSLLNQIVSEQPACSADGLLAQLDERVQQTLRQEGHTDESLDGLDLALCILSLREPVLEFAGAGRPLYQLRNRQLIKYEGDRLPVGGAQFKYKAYRSTRIDLLAGDRFYLFTDGITDQFGFDEAGRKRKFTPVRLQEWIADNYSTSLKRQESILTRLLTEWQGNEEQLDDLTLLAFEWKTNISV